MKTISAEANKTVTMGSLGTSLCIATCGVTLTIFVPYLEPTQRTSVQTVSKASGTKA